MELCSLGLVLGISTKDSKYALRLLVNLQKDFAWVHEVPGAEVRGQPHIPPILVQTQSSDCRVCVHIW
jgi:hypothetical protein